MCSQNARRSYASARRTSYLLQGAAAATATIAMPSCDPGLLCRRRQARPAEQRPAGRELQCDGRREDRQARGHGQYPKLRPLAPRQIGRCL